MSSPRNTLSSSSSRPLQEDEREVRLTEYMPTPIDIAVVRAMMVKALALPLGLVDSIFDHAEYWAHSAVELHQGVMINGSSPNENKLLLRSYPLGMLNLGGKETDRPGDAIQYAHDPIQPLPLVAELDARSFARLAKYPTPRLQRPARKIVFYIKSCDQGWGADKTSWTWFEAGLERFDASHVSQSNRPSHSTSHARGGEECLPRCALRSLRPRVEKDESSGAYRHDFPLLHSAEWEVQRNSRVERNSKEFLITWSYLDNVDGESEEAERLAAEGRGKLTADGKFVRDLKFGDVITLWGKARFPGWRNHVEAARLEVYWAV